MTAEAPPSAALVAFYRERLAAFDAERAELLARVEACTTTREELHRTGWEAHKRAAELSELQKALSDAHTFLFEERERLLSLQGENDELKLQIIENRRKLEEFLRLNQPLVQQQLKATYTQKRRPEQAAVPEDSSVRGPSIDRVLRTVYLPTNNAETLLLRIESLLAQLHDTKQFMNERVAAMMEDKRIREQEEESRAARDQDIIKELSDKLNKREDVLQQTTRDYVALKRNVAKELQERTEACERLSAECDSLRASNEQLQMEYKALGSIQSLPSTCNEAVEHIRELIKRRVALRSSSGNNGDTSGEQVQLMLAELESDIESATHALKETMHKERESRISVSKEELHQRDMRIRNLGEAQTAVVAQYEERISVLESKLSKAKEENRTLAYRRALDIEGFAAETTALRKSLAIVDRKLLQMRLLDRLGPEDDRLEEMLAYLEKRVPSGDGSDVVTKRVKMKPGPHGEVDVGIWRTNSRCVYVLVMSWPSILSRKQCMCCPLSNDSGIAVYVSYNVGVWCSWWIVPMLCIV